MSLFECRLSWPNELSNSGLLALNRADVITFLAVQRKLTGRKDEHMPRGFPVLKIGTKMEVVKSLGAVIVHQVEQQQQASVQICAPKLVKLTGYATNTNCLSHCSVTSQPSALDRCPV